ncbi:hypothetical protein N7491_010667, partial [Penicillium cf. griseofulvum]
MNNPKKKLAATSLSLPDIHKILGLTLVVDDKSDSVAPISIPEDLRVCLERSDRAYCTSCANEASIRCKLNLLLFYAYDLVSSSANQSAIPLNIPMEPCIYKQRKDLGKIDTIVYGISTDAMGFLFMKVDNESR